MPASVFTIALDFQILCLDSRTMPHILYNFIWNYCNALRHNLHLRRVHTTHERLILDFWCQAEARNARRIQNVNFVGAFYLLNPSHEVHPVLHMLWSPLPKCPHSSAACVTVNGCLSGIVVWFVCSHSILSVSECSGLVRGPWVNHYQTLSSLAFQF